MTQLSLTSIHLACTMLSSHARQAADNLAHESQCRPKNSPERAPMRDLEEALKIGSERTTSLQYALLAPVAISSSLHSALTEHIPAFEEAISAMSPEALYIKGDEIDDKARDECQKCASSLLSVLELFLVTLREPSPDEQGRILGKAQSVLSDAEQARNAILQRHGLIQPSTIHEPPPPYVVDHNTVASTTAGPSSVSLSVSGILDSVRSTVASLVRKQADPLVVAFCAAAEQGDLDSMEDLVRKGVDISGTDENGNTAIRCAIRGGRRNAARFLLLRGATLATDSMNQPPLYLAAKASDVEMVRLLLDFGVDPNTRDLTGLSVFTESLRNKRLDVAQLLLERGADPHGRDLLGRPPLVLAAYYGNSDLVSGLLARGASPNARDETGRSLLSWAVEKRNAPLVRQLLDFGADPNVREHSGRHVVATAVDMREAAMVRLFVEHSANLTYLDAATRLQAERLMAPEHVSRTAVPADAPPAYGY